MQPMQFRDRWILVTGASSGLGREMALLLARQHGAKVLAVARRRDRLDELKAAASPGVIEPLVADLAQPADVEAVIGAATEGRPLYGAILNAGVTHFGPHHELEWPQFLNMLQVNVTSTVRLATALLPAIERGAAGGGLLLVSSMAGVTPLPYQSAYSGTKAFLIHFGAGLWFEHRAKNVSVTTFAPGGIVTEMTAGESFGPLRGWLMPVEATARQAIEAFRTRRYLAVPGLSNRLQTLALRLLPRQFVTARVGATYRAALEKAAKAAARRD